MKIGLVGYGAMGKVIEQCVAENDELIIFAPELKTVLDDTSEKVDVLIDFSNPRACDAILAYAEKNNVPVVIAATGHSSEQLDQIAALATHVPVLKSANFSLGVNLVNRMLREYAPILKDFFDIEIIEKHHRLKEDAPSGTAKLFADTINETLHYDFVNGRDGFSKRQDEEIGIHAVRGGSIVGEHEVIFAGMDEIISLKHEAFSKNIFANGALNGAKWLVDKEAGLYDMEAVLFGK